MVLNPISDTGYKRVNPYQILSLIYDDMMNHVDYARWTQYIEFLIEKYGLSTHKLLEIGCGTGTFAQFFSYPLLGIDRYMEMLKRYRSKNPDAILLLDKMPELKSLKHDVFSGILLLYDSINYIRIPADWLLFFKRVYSILEKHGWMIFDVVTDYCCKIYFLNDIMHEQFEDISYKRVVMYDEGNHIQHNFFYIHTPEGNFLEHHEQYIPEISWIEKQIKKAGFRQIVKFHEFTMKKPHKKSLRVHFLIRK